MSIKNLFSVSFTEAELTTIDNALATIATTLQGKTANLSPEERSQYGRIAEQNKLFVNKAKTYMEQYPEYVPPFIDKAEFDKDYEARQQIEPRIKRLEAIAEQLSDTKKLLDYDNYTNALTFYRNIRFLSQENVPGINTIHQDMAQFFSKTATELKNENLG